ncbi:hypothetical protein QBC33DRAFT_197185 [Phialemonium atrogriseum]|uniref:Uncharacterized protein n=1 Tax=Phialemonium atrogriseum TaxID=1093897 RepID=A0AAJ0BUR2_9PEZI|nr:uncharacterized protein QBC33DRAFT_197185 [Phialemonium atrogriseum]KAK1764357.1 hypothetical protein QBC33DRAFT_197185 [Phialemonium atrogriseum]
MAPLNGATGKPSAGGGRWAPQKPVVPVVPVVPLPYVRRQASSNPRRAAVSQSAPLQQTGNNPAASNHHQNYHQTEPRKKEQDEGSQTTATDNGTRKGTGKAYTEETPPAREAEAATPPAAPANVAPVAPVSPPLASPSKKDFDTPTAPSAAAPQEHLASPTPTRPRHHLQSNGDSGNHSARPGSVTKAAVTHHRHPHPAAMNQHRMHQTHPSMGSLIFGGFYGSNTTSPAPHSGGAYRPPDLMSYPPEAMPIPAVDQYGRPLLVSPTADGFPPPAMSHHGPPTPHSFHGSQSSMQAEENGFAHYPVMNGHDGYPVHHPMGQPQRHMAAMDRHMAALPPVASASASDFAISRMQIQTLSFLRGGIEHGDFSDCTLELHIANSPPSADHAGHHQSQPSLRIPCHRFILSQSPTLKHILQTRGTSPDGVLLLDLQDQYLRPEAFYFTIRTLYGWDFGDDFLPTYMGFQGVKDEFDHALGYAAAARYLQLPLVHARAIHYACRRLLHWETIEKACEFALPSAIFGHPARHDASPSTEHFSVAELLDAIIAFVVNRLPPNFVLDTTVGGCGFSRLPSPSPVPPRTRNMPAIARGTSGPGTGSHSRHPSNAQAQMPRNPRLSTNPRLSQIQFGDLSPQVENGAESGDGDQGAAAATARMPTPWDTIISRILLNLPFPLLKQVLEHPALCKPSGDLTMQARHNLITSVIAEREARRLRTLVEGDPQLKVFQERLDGAVEPLPVQQMGDFLVNNMGFKEEVFPGDVPYLVQSWVHSGSGSISA